MAAESKDSLISNSSENLKVDQRDLIAEELLKCEYVHHDSVDVQNYPNSIEYYIMEANATNMKIHLDFKNKKTVSIGGSGYDQVSI